MLDPDKAIIVLDLFSFILLAWPALIIARMAGRTSKFIDIKLNPDQVDKSFIDLKNEADKDVLKEVGEWKPWHNWFFYTGLCLSLLSYLIKIFVL